MKKLVFSILCIICAIVSSQSELKAQDYESGDPYMMGQIMEQMSTELNDVPFNIRRVSVYKINYSSFRFTSEEIEYIRAEIESAFREYAGLTVLSPPELEPNDKMKIIGSDSTLQILNVRGRSLADISPEYLTEITVKYGIHALIELSVQRRNTEGIVIALRMMNPNSREVVWTRSFISNRVIIEEKADKGRTSVISIGVGNRTIDKIFHPDTTVILNDTTFKKNVIDLHATFSYRQPLNIDNSAFIGFTGGFHLLNSRESNSYNMQLIELGITYFQAVSPLNTDLNLYRIMFYLNGNIQFPFGSQSGEMFTATPGLMLNLSENIGISFYSSILLSGETIKKSNNEEVTFNKVGYGVHGVIRF